MRKGAGLCTWHHRVPFLESLGREELCCVIGDEGLIGFELDDFGWDYYMSVMISHALVYLLTIRTCAVETAADLHRAGCILLVEIPQENDR